MSLNQAIIIGHLGQEPEVRQVNEKFVATINVATSMNYKDKAGQPQVLTEWHRVVVWGPSASFIQKYVHKGDQVMVQGYLRTSSWEKDGKTNYRTEIVSQNFQKLSSKSGGDQASQESHQDPSPDPQPNTSWDGDDLPF